VKRIQTLGGLAAFDGPRPLGGNAQQPRRLAILAVLARAGDRGVSRDRLAGMLWGDVEEERARRSLNQALYALRQELGSEDAILGTRDLRLNPELVEVDLAAFENARGSGAFEEAARLYAGPFLGDFNLPGVPAFARWADEERAGIAADHRALLEAAAAAATARDDRGGAVLWWRRLAALDPADTRAAQGLMRALAAAGDAPGALRHADIVHQIRQQELELPPDPDVAALAERIRRGEGVLPPATPPAGRSQPERGEEAEPPRSPPRNEEPPPRRRPLPARAAVVGVLLLLAAVLVWSGLRRTAEAAGPRRLAVLPFENLGDSADAYFADGIANELRAKLSQLDGVEVIARASSNHYRSTTKTPEAIARELGARYLLTATVQWDKASGGPSRVRVSPELVEVTAEHPPRAAWQQPFAAALTDVFAVQADIAAQVAGALGVVLGDSARRELRLKPTESLAAYDEFLKGEAAAQEMKASQAGLRRAIAFYERAVSLDTAFAQAWSQLSRARTSLYSNGVPDPALGEAARAAKERARALRPDDPLVHLAAGEIHSSVNPIDNARALAEYQRGLRLAPGDGELLSATAIAEALLQRWDSVAPRLERARLLDPRSLTPARRLATVRIFLRQYAAADSAVDRAIVLGPTNPQIALLKVMVALGRGDRAAADAAARAAATRIDPATLLPFLATYQDLFWVLDDEQQRQVLALPPSAFDDDRGVWGIVRAQLYHFRGDFARAAVYADSARIALEEQSRAAPEDAQRHALVGLALAYLGRKAEAVREGRRGVELLPLARDGFNGPYVQLQLVRIYLLTGEPDQALDQLEPLLRVPFYVSPGWLRLDPAFASLRTHPRFARLVAP
jgi:DNA-binding SARP family transcriptional activator/TolB-like protein